MFLLLALCSVLRVLESVYPPGESPSAAAVSFAPVAQLVEQLTLNQRVLGSSPWWRTIPLFVGYPGPLVKWLRQRPLTPLTWVRIPYGSPTFPSSGFRSRFTGGERHGVKRVFFPANQVCAENCERVPSMNILS